jgi:16S rRNA (cytosine967-C5)-methyltransferase|tara:strand:- start:1539 stop:2741 length:1203 start_codon:yes stop_codon:yes gene_type:complete
MLDQVLASGKQSPLARELTYGVTRHFYSLSAELQPLLERPLRDRDLDLFALMLVGAYQLRHLQIPPHAAINETVAAAHPLGKPWARNLINGVLRSLQRSPTPTPQDDSVRYDHPSWLIERVSKEYPDQWRDLLSANNARAPMAIRINLTRTSVQDYTHLLGSANIASQPGWLPETVILEQPMPVAKLPGYAEGLVSVQDAGAQFAAYLLTERLSAPSSILDACAAPGGKTFHLLERAPHAKVSAMDVNSSRLDTLRRSAVRLGHEVRTLCADASNDRLAARYDHILLDAPCSGSGTLRRHPDIKLLREPADVGVTARVQALLLRHLWHALRPSGTLLYCTCSLLREENDSIVAVFLNTHTDASAAPIELPSGAATRYGWQLLPLDPRTDAFYFAALVKSK